MSNYRKMSDFEVNREVASKSGESIRVFSDQLFTKPYITDENCNVIDYCSNPSYAIPIMIKGGIGLVQPIITGDKWQATGYKGEVILDEFLHEHDNPLRAAMIVFLMMNEEN